MPSHLIEVFVFEEDELLLADVHRRIRLELAWIRQ